MSDGKFMIIHLKTGLTKRFSVILLIEISLNAIPLYKNEPIFSKIL